MRARPFSKEFGAHWAVQAIVQAAGREGGPVCPDTVIPALAHEFPDFSPSELTRMLCAAALDAQVPIAPDAGAGS